MKLTEVNLYNMNHNNIYLLKNELAIIYADVINLVRVDCLGRQNDLTHCNLQANMEHVHIVTV